MKSTRAFNGVTRLIITLAPDAGVAAMLIVVEFKNVKVGVAPFTVTTTSAWFIYVNGIWNWFVDPSAT